MALTKVPNSMLVSPGGSTKNYLSNYNNNPGNGDFELNLTNGWSLFNTTITNQIPTGSIVAGASSLSFSTTSIGKLAGSYSLRVRAVDSGGGGVWNAGHGFISDAFTVDEQDRTSVMQLKFSYKGISNTTRLNVSGTTSNTLAVYIYDVTNSTWIQPTSSFGINQRTTVGFVNGSFQAVSTSTQYRIAVLAINGSGTGGGDIVVDFDDYIIGPSNYTYGTPVTDWVSWTPTGTWTTNSTYTGQWRQVGDTREYKVKIALAGAPTAANLSVNLPAGHVIDTAKLPQTTAGTGTLGYGSILDSGVAIFPAAVNYSTTTQVALYATVANATYDTFTNITQAAPTTFGASDAIDIQFSVPILGLSSSVQMSESTETRSVNFVGYVASNTALTANVTDITLTSRKDSHAGWNTNSYTVRVPGDYQITGYGSATTAATMVISVYVTGSIVRTLFASISGANTSGSTVLENLKSGDVISFRSGQTLSIVADTTGSFTITRISGPVTIAASSKVNTSGSNTASTSISNGSWTAVPTATIPINSHGALTTGGVFTAPSPDAYTVTANVCFAANATGIRGVRIRKNNAATGFGSVIPATSGGAITSVPIAGLVQCNEGDTITVECFQNSGGALALSNDPDTYTTFTITRK